MLEALRSLPAARLRELATAFRQGALGMPCSELSLQRTITADQVPGLKHELDELAGAGYGTAQAAVLCDVLAETAEMAAAAADRTRLVWTGPDAPGIDSRDTKAVLEELFKAARQSVLIAGYVVYQGKDVFRELGRRMEKIPELSVKMFLNVGRTHQDTRADDAILTEFRDRFRSEWPGSRLPDVYFDPRGLATDPKSRASLHAKAVIVDQKRAFVTSANFTEAAQVKNIEVGVLIRDPLFAAQLAQHFQGLAAAGVLRPVVL